MRDSSNCVDNYTGRENGRRQMFNRVGGTISS